MLFDFFSLSLIRRRDAPALDVDDATGSVRTLTFGEIDARAARTASALIEHGVGPGDRVGIYLSNRVEFIDLFLACLRLGAIIVPMNILYRQREIGHIVADAGPTLVVSDEAGIERLAGLTRALDVAQLTAESAAGIVSDVRPRVSGDDPAAIVYTSGTTGRPKGAVLTHRNFLANAETLLSCWQITDADRYLAVLPLFHVHGLANGVCSWLASGCRMRLVERFSLERAASLFEGFEPTLFFGVPTIYVRLLELPVDAARSIGRGMRLFVSGSAPLPAHVFEAFEARFGHRILERYGMSETLMLISNPYLGERRAGTVGMPLPGVSVRLVRPDGGRVADNEVGHVEVSGSNVFSGYWHDGAATAAAFRDGWFRTGDLAERSSDGYYTLRGRATDLIISGGFNIYPREIEELLLESDTIEEAVVIGAPDEHRGEVPVAYVVAHDGFDADAARELCARNLASFKVPRAFIRIEALPRNALGKIQKHLLPPPEL
jgi:malonyl-CoA/methylmalonyl-CoA synthetase